MKARARYTTRKRVSPHIGSRFEDFLREEGRLEEATALAIKRVLAWEFEHTFTPYGAEGLRKSRRAASGAEGRGAEAKKVRRTGR